MIVIKPVKKTKEVVGNTISDKLQKIINMLPWECDMVFDDEFFRKDKPIKKNKKV